MCDSRYWSRDFLTKFIQKYKSHPCLWKVKDKQYSNKKLKAAAYEELTELCKTVYPTANRDFVIKKIQSCRGSFRKELKKVMESKRSAASSGAVYHSSLWYYELLLFTKEQEIPADSADAENDVFSSMDDSSSEHGVKHEQAQDVQLPGTSGARPKDFVQPKKQERNLPAAECKFELPKPCPYALNKNNEVNELDAVGISVASKLKRMDTTQAIYAEMLINKILGRGLLKLLTQHTDIHDSNTVCIEFDRSSN